jgi:hypothetical protein
MREDGIVAIEPKTSLDSWTSPWPRRTDSAAGLFICRQLHRDAVRLFRPIAITATNS